MQNVYGLTPMMLAAELGSHSTVEVLLRYGANGNNIMSTGQTALINAVHSGNLQCVKLLLAQPNLDVINVPLKLDG